MRDQIYGNRRFPGLSWSTNKILSSVNSFDIKLRRGWNSTKYFLGPFYILTIKLS